MVSRQWSELVQDSTAQFIPVALAFCTLIVDVARRHLGILAAPASPLLCNTEERTTNLVKFKFSEAKTAANPRFAFVQT